jgi:hypothetical protein
MASEKHERLLTEISQTGKLTVEDIDNVKKNFIPVRPC